MMNRIFVVFLSLLLLGAVVFVPTSCRRSYPEDPRLSALKALGDSQPREALSRLDALKDSVSVLSLYERRRYDLLRLRLQDKSFIIPESDSTAKALCAYFERHGSPADRMEAYYYLASVYRDLHDSPQAITYFLKCAEMPDRYQGMDSLLLTKACSQLYDLYRVQYDYASALRMVQREIEVAEKIKCVGPVTFMDAVSVYHDLEDTLNAVLYQNKALEMIRHNGEIVLYGHVLAEMLGNYIRYGMSAKAETCKKMLEKIPAGKLPGNYYVNMATYYTHTSQPDSAINYYHKTYSRHTINGMFDGSRHLTKIYAGKGEYEKAAFWGVRFIEAQDAFEENREHEQSINAHNEFVYRRDREAEAAAYRKAREAQWLLVAMAGALLAVLVGSALWVLAVKYKSAVRERKRLEEIIAKDRELRDSRKEIEHINSLLGNHRKQLAAVRERLAETSGALADSEERIACLDRNLAEKNLLLAQRGEVLRQTEELMREREQMLEAHAERNSSLIRYTFLAELENSGDKDIVRKIECAVHRREPVEEMTRSEWKRFYAAIDHIFPDFRLTLRQRVYPLPEDKLRLGCLLKAGLTKPQIIRLTGLKQTSVWRKARELEKALGEELKGGFSGSSSPAE